MVISNSCFWWNWKPALAEQHKSHLGLGRVFYYAKNKISKCYFYFNDVLFNGVCHDLLQHCTQHERNV